MRRLTTRRILSLVIVLLTVIFSRSSLLPSSVPPSSPILPTHAVLSAKEAVYEVVKVVDGDTITVSKDGTKETVRLIGINTPETVDPRKPVECFGKEASAKMKELVAGKHVRLIGDPTQEDKDKYGRLLRYVFLEDNTFINRYMIAEGYAYEYTYAVPYQYQNEFKAAQAEAEKSGKGLWGVNICP